MDNNEKTTGVYLDLQKAFDIVVLCYIITKLYGRPALMSICSSGSLPLAFIWFSLHVIHLANKSSSSSSSCTALSMLCSDNFITDDKGLQFYTGLDNYTMFRTVLASLGPAAYHLNYLYDKNPTLSIPNYFSLWLS